MKIVFTENIIVDNSSSEETNIKLEYENLRREIANNDSQGTQLLTGTLIIVVAAMGFGLKGAPSPLLRIGAFCAVTGIITVVMRQTTDRIRMTFLIAAYIRRFIEPKLKEIKWETRLFYFRKLHKKTRFDKLNNVLLIYFCIGFLNLIVALGFYIQSMEILQSTYLITCFKNVEYQVASDVWIGLFFILNAILVFGLNTLKIYNTLKQFIDNNEEFIAAKWDEVEKAMLSDLK